MSRFNIYPVLYTFETASGRVVNGICSENWNKVRNDIERGHALGTVKSFRFTTAIDRQMRGQKG